MYPYFATRLSIVTTYLIIVFKTVTRIIGWLSIISNEYNSA